MRRNIPSLQSLICFESAAKHASYTHASQELFITQSAVSRQIQQQKVLNPFCKASKKAPLIS